MPKSSALHCVAASCLLGVLAASAQAAASKGGELGLRFNSPEVLDLAERSQKVRGGGSVAVGELTSADAERIFAAPAIDENPPALRFSDDEFGCTKPSRRCSMEHERQLIAAAAAAVKRDGRRLTITPSAGVPAVFVDWKQPTTKTADGDEESHWYLGRLPGSGYVRVEVQFGHDAPGNFLINPQSGQSAFVHNGADLVSPSPDGRLLLTWNALNPPFSLRVAALDAAGPRLALQCSAADGEPRITPVFKGWQGVAGFDLVLEIGEQSKSMARAALHVSRDGSHWRIAASDIARVDRLRLSCQENTALP